MKQAFVQPPTIGVKLGWHCRKGVGGQCSKAVICVEKRHDNKTRGMIGTRQGHAGCMKPTSLPTKFGFSLTLNTWQDILAQGESAPTSV